MNDNAITGNSLQDSLDEFEYATATDGHSFPNTIQNGTCLPNQQPTQQATAAAAARRAAAASEMTGVTTSAQKSAAAASVISTESVTAVNSNIVRAATHKVLAGSDFEGLDDVVYGAASTAKAAKAIARRVRKYRTDKKQLKMFQDEMPDARLGKVHLLHKDDIVGSAKASAKNAVTGVIHSSLQGSELEGADEAIYQANAVRKGASSVVRKSTAFIRERKNATDAARAAQAKRNLHAAISRNRAAAPTIRQSLAGAWTNMAKAPRAVAQAFGTPSLASAAAIFAPIVLALLSVLLVCTLMAPIITIAPSSSVSDAPMEGLPEWVTYEFVDSCLKAHEKYGYPAGALLGQMIIENGSGSGSSLGRQYHNYAGVKWYHGIESQGANGHVGMWTTEYANDGTPYQCNALFATFASADDFMRYRCEHLLQQDNYKNVPLYQQAIDSNNSEDFIRALVYGGYCTTSADEYVAMYKSIANSYPIVAALDSMTSAQFEATYGSLNQNLNATQEAILAACHSVPCAGAKACAAWCYRVYTAAGISINSGNGNTILTNNTANTSTDWSKIQVGQLLSAESYGAGDSNPYGHCAIYIGNGQVMENVTINGTGRVSTRSLDAWVSYYQSCGWVKYGWPW